MDFTIGKISEELQFTTTTKQEEDEEEEDEEIKG